MITKAPQSKKTTLYEALVANRMDGCDICDFDWDWGIYLGLPEAKSVDKCEDGYDKLMLLLALNIKTTGINREGYRPSDYGHELKADEDSGYYEVYMLSMENLIAGNYALDDYDKLVGYLLEK